MLRPETFRVNGCPGSAPRAMIVATVAGDSLAREGSSLIKELPWV
jgi:hypothetical protein